MSAADASGSARAASPLYFVNAPVDVLAVGGLSVLVWAALVATDGALLSKKAYLGVVFAFNFLLNFPHFFATSYRLYHSMENVRQYPLTAVAVPVVVLAGAACALVWPGQVAPVYVAVFLLWSPYHYAGQTVGISLLYARRAGFVMAGLERFALASFSFSTFVVLMTNQNSTGNDIVFFGLSTPSFNLPGYLVDLSVLWMAVCALLLGFVVVRWTLRSGRLFPLIVLVPPAAQFIWFFAGASIEVFYAFLPFFHGLQYLFIAWVTQLKEVRDQTGAEPSRRFVVLQTLRWGVIIFLGGILLFYAAPVGIEWLGVHPVIAWSVVLATVNMHHFFVDGVIWKLHNPRVGSILSVDLRELSGRAA